jgi:hypothetical protein
MAHSQHVACALGHQVGRATIVCHHIIEQAPTHRQGSTQRQGEVVHGSTTQLLQPSWDLGAHVYCMLLLH